jgi:hypothetical protein
MTTIGDTGPTLIDRGADKSTRRTTYIVIAVVMLALIVVGLVTRPAREAARANERADQLTAALEEAGVAAPSSAQIVNVLGHDGGAICADPNSALKRGLLGTEIANGAAGPGQRPVITDDMVVRGEALVISIYCPDQLDEFEDFVRTMAFDNVING